MSGRWGSERNFHLLLCGYLVPTAKIKLFPRGHRQGKSAVLFKDTRYRLKAQTDN